MLRDSPFLAVAAPWDDTMLSQATLSSSTSSGCAVSNCKLLYSSSIDGPSEPHLVPKLLLQVSVWELHNSIVSPLEEGGFRETRDAENNNIINDSTLG